MRHVNQSVCAAFVASVYHQAVKSGRLNEMDALLINCTLSNLTLDYRRDAVILRRLHIGHTLATHK